MKAWVRLRNEKLNKVSWARAAGGATAISLTSPTRAPQAGSSICTTATASARIRAKWPSSMIMAHPARRAARGRGRPRQASVAGGPAPARCGAAGARSRQAPARSPCLLSSPASFLHALLGRAAGTLPHTLLLQGLGHFRRHVGLIMLGEHGIGQQAARSIQGALGDNTLTLAEEVRQNAGIGDLDALGGIGYGELDGAAAAALEAAERNQAAEANALARANALLCHFARGVEEDDGIAQGQQHQQHGDAEDGHADADEKRAPLLTGHEPSPKLTARAESSPSARSSPAKWRRASARASRASLLRSSTT